MTRSNTISVLALFALFATDAAAQRAPVEFGSSPNPVGSGARALGIASAFIATADDATAASWNPAGLIILEEPEVSFVLSLKNRNEYFAGIGIKEGKEVQRHTYPDLNYLSGAYPFKIGHRFFVAALSFQSLIDFDKRVDKTFFVSGAQGLRGSYETSFLQEGSITALTPSLAFQISPTVSFGLSLNLSTDKLGFSNGWHQEQTYNQQLFVGTSLTELQVSQKESFGLNAFGANVGMMWDATAQWTIGAVFKTPLWGTLTHEIEELSDSEFGSIDAASFDESIRFPLSYGVGFAYRHSDELTASIDLYRTEWSLFRHELTEARTGDKRPINPIDSQPYNDSKVGGITQVHLGAERLFIFPRTVVPLRGGFFYDPEPGATQTDHFFGLAVGTGISIADLVIDAAYQFRFSTGAHPDVVRINQEGAGGGGDAVTTGSAGGSIWQHLIYISTIYHF